MEMMLLNLPKEMVLIILLKLPASSLVQLKLVCKYFWNLITNPSFVKMHLDHQLNNNNNHPRLLFYVSVDAKRCPRLYSSNGYGCSGGDEETLEVPFPFDGGFEILCYSCNGLFCVQTRNRTTCIWNPTTNEIRKLPCVPSEFPPTKGYSSRTSYGFGYDRKNDDYKVIKCTDSLLYQSETYLVVVEVYTLRTDSWRTIPDNKNPFSSYRLENRHGGVLVNGALHWIITSAVTKKNIIVSWDVEDEEFRKVPKPAFSDGHWDLQILKDRLCVVHTCHGLHKDFWVMNDYGVKDSWTILFRVSLSVFYGFRKQRIIIREENGELLLGINDTDVLIFYNPKTGKARHVKWTSYVRSQGSQACVYNITTYVESLVSLPMYG